MQEIKKVVVIGSGVMGSAIAAQVANSHTRVVLLDLVSASNEDRSTIARQAKDRLLSISPPPLSHFSNANYISIGNLEDDLAAIKDADLIIEVIIEKLSIKHDLYEKIVKYMANNNALLASNTSTLPRKDLIKGLPSSLHDRFYITHFFNPPRYMELLELVVPDNNDSEVIKNSNTLTHFIERKLGKKVIICKDTPGFIANRIGCFFLEMAVRRAIKAGLKPTIIDKIAAKYFAFPSTGIFALYDLIGHDVMELISLSLTSSLPKSDRYNEIYSDNSTLNTLKEAGSLGRKAEAGFYKINKITSGSGQVKKVTYQLDFNNMSYEDVSSIKMPDLPNNLEDFLNSNNEYSVYFKDLMQEYFNYCIALIPSVTKNASDIDDAIELGYGMKKGPFKLLAIMPDSLQKYITNGAYQKKLPENNKNNKSNKASDKIINQTSSSLLIEKSSGYFFSLESKMGTLNTDIFNTLIKAIDLAEHNNKDLYICSNAPVFSAGADLKYFLEKINNKEFDEISQLIKLGQQAMMRLKYSTVAITTAAAGLALGGGTEILLQSPNTIMHQNINAGLVEVSVGLIPGWGGTKEMIMRGVNSANTLLNNISNIIFHRKTNSAEYFNEQYSVDCVLNMNSRYLLEEAVKLPKKPRQQQSSQKIIIPKIQLQTLSEKFNNADELQIYLIKFFQEIIDQQNLTEDELLQAEHDQFIKLCKMPHSIEKICSVLKK